MVHGPGDALGVLALVAAAATVAGVARRLNWSAPLLAVLAGLIASQLPGMPIVRIEPDIVLTLILPPLLFSAALDSSYLNFRRNLRPIGLLSVGLVLFTALLLGGVMYAVVPDLTLPAAITLGAIVAPPDAVAATAIGRRLGLPRRLVVILAGESLVNDATALTAYRVAVAAAVGTGFSFVSATGVFVVAAAGGVLVGVAVAWVVKRLIARLTDPVVESTLMLLAPFIAFLLAEAMDASGVLAVVVAGLLIGHKLPRVATYASRLQAGAVWKMIDFLLESVVFMLIGLQLSTLSGLRPWSIAQLAGWAGLATAVVIVARFAWVFPATYLPTLLSRRLRERDPAPSWRMPVVVGWAGMRGVVSIAAAYALPVGFPGRDLVTFLTFCVVIATLVLQGLTLPTVIRRLGVAAEEERRADNLAEAGAQHTAINAALSRLEELLAEDGDVPTEIVHRLRDRAEVRSLAAWERLGGPPDDALRETPTAAYRRLRRDMLEAERAVFVQLRDEGRIDDEVLRRVQLELDLEEAMMSRD